LGAQIITFKLTAPSRLHWAGRPAMRVVQALQWLRGTMDSDHDRIARRLSAILADPIMARPSQRICETGSPVFRTGCRAFSGLC